MQRSFVPVAPDCHFPIQNLPYGVFSTPERQEARIGVRIGEFVLDLREMEHRGFFRDVFGEEHVLCKRSLNKFMGRGREVWRAVRQTLTRLLSEDCATLRDDTALRAAVLIPADTVRMHLPCEIGDYTDFYSSREHATNVGKMFRGEANALLPNWTWLPVGYHGRSSSIGVSPQEIRRPLGQSNPKDEPQPQFGPSRMVDFELEVGALIGPGNDQGEPIPVGDALGHVFGLVLVNDWSARDIQKWEYVPLGPFLAKNFATTISPWVVPMEALAPFACGGPKQEPAPLEYLRDPSVTPTFDIRLEARLRTPTMREGDVICRTNFRNLYWSIAQQVAHHTIGGCNLRPGDLLASGTISGAAADSFGSLLELAWRGERPLTLSSGESRASLQDGDELTLSGWCQAAGYRVGFGECSGRITPAVQGR